MSMTRQEQLDAVVRNYGEWPDDEDLKFAALRDAESRVCFFNQIFASQLDRPAFTRSEVEVRKSVLQNKPSWSDAPDGAKILVYVPCLAQWVFASFSNASPEHDDWFGIGRGDWFLDNGVQGKVIGDWRDTLEKRPAPEVTPEEEEAFNMLEARNSNDVFGKNLSVYGDSGSLTDEGGKWDGEGLPPVGDSYFCKYTDDKRFIVSHDLISNPPMAIVCDDSGYWGAPASAWSQEKSARDKWASAAMDVEERLDAGYTPYDLACALYDAGLAKLPE